MKRYLIILVLCGSAFAQMPDPLQALEDEHTVLSARIRDVTAQIDFYRRKELFYQGVVAGVEKADDLTWGDIEQVTRKRRYFEDLRSELLNTRSGICQKLGYDNAVL